MKLVPSSDFSILYPLIAYPLSFGATQSRSSVLVVADVTTRPVTWFGLSPAHVLATFDVAPAPNEFIALTL